MNAKHGDDRYCPECRETGVVLDQAGYHCPSCGAAGDLLALVQLAKEFNFSTGESLASRQRVTEPAQSESRTRLPPSDDAKTNAKRSDVRICFECREPGLVLDQAGYRCPSCGTSGDLLALSQLTKEFDFASGEPIYSTQLDAGREQSEAQPAGSSTDEQVWFCRIENKKIGPCSEQEMKKMALAGTLTLATRVSTAGYWQPADSIPKLKAIVEDYPPELPPQPLATTCVFCATKPSRQAAGVCEFPMSRSVNIGGMFKHQKIQTTTATVPLPICLKCGQAMKAMTWLRAICLLLTATLIVLLVATLKEDESVNMTYAILLIGSLVLTVAAGILMPLVLAAKLGLGRYTLSGLASAHEAVNPDDARLQRAEALKGLGSDVGLASVPDIYKLYLQGFGTRIAFDVFPGSAVTLNNNGST